MSEPGNLISVRADVAASLLIDGLHAEAEQRLATPLDREVSEVFDEAADPRAARLGYVARIIEVERFAPARAPMPWLTARLESNGPRSALSVGAALAEEEPLAKPGPDDGTPSWRVPGPGGHVRHFLALRAVGGGPAENKRSWMLGFFARCCEEAAHTARG